MPKSKVRKKSEYTITPSSLTPTKVSLDKPSSTLYVSTMLGLGVFGILWIMVFYLFVATPSRYAEPGQILHWMQVLGNWNFLIGIGIIVVALLMSLRWK